MGKNRRQHGFTLVELLVALMVSSIVLSAVATLAYATSSAKEATDDMGREQAQLRQVSMRVTDLVKRSNEIFGAFEIGSLQGFQLWHDTNADGVKGSGETMWILNYYNNGPWSLKRSIRIISDSGTEIYTQCTNPTFEYGWENGQRRTVAIWFDMDANGQTQRHSINAHLRVSDDY